MQYRRTSTGAEVPYDNSAANTFDLKEHEPKHPDLQKYVDAGKQFAKENSEKRTR